ncbi:ATP synthase F1 subunit epsilon [Candidatus Pelagibacter bacterium]|jgi:F-type H+-transporting ATPase subunit epsilon|nr:ATP synthase F1 subunit epsilon [Candidatus Pelagibacter bacterium]|tara:strand:+ start:419 stop:808 length:390 start_codon:yes stop_codon:yes gene_type:complete
MSNKFTVEIISPDQTVLKSETSEVTIPAYEGQMGILRDHIPLITFLRPGFIIIKNEEEKKFYVEEGTVEFSNNNLLILTSSVKNFKNLNKDLINDLIEEAEKKYNDSNSSDKEKYIISYKIDTLKEINQ